MIGVESSDGPAMQRSVQAGKLETIECNTIIDGLRVRRAGELNFSVVQRFVDDIVTLPDKQIFESMMWVMERCKLVVEGGGGPGRSIAHPADRFHPTARGQSSSGGSRPRSDRPAG